MDYTQPRRSRLAAKVAQPPLWARGLLSMGLLALGCGWVLSQVDARMLDGARTQWNAIVSSGRQLPREAQLRQINRKVNQHLLFQADSEIWQRDDFWATPLESLAMQAGDCEDFSIAKYAALLQLGVPAEQLRLIYVRARLPVAGGGERQQAHMVVGYYPNPQAIPWILDNLIPDILPADQRYDLHPVFSFNTQGLWAGGRRAAASPSERLSRWRDLLRRMQQEGTLLPATAGLSRGQQ